MPHRDDRAITSPPAAIVLRDSHRNRPWTARFALTWTTRLCQDGGAPFRPPERPSRVTIQTRPRSPPRHGHRFALHHCPDPPPRRPAGHVPAGARIAAGRDELELPGVGQ